MTVKREYKSYKSLSEFAKNYDGFLIDLWGVIHDGQETYPGVHRALSYLKENDKKIIFVSNAPRRAWRAKEQLEKFGIKEAEYDYLITSGEVTFDYVKEGGHSLGKNFMIIGPARDDGLLDGLDELTHVKDISKASFLIATGFDNDDSTIAEVMPLLEKGASLKLPMICANPDIEVVRLSGKRALCAGVIANKYEEIGGRVERFGKPYKRIYQNAISFMAIENIQKIAAIGDNLHTDILGAKNFNIDSYLIAGGILAKPLNISHGQLPNESAALELFAKEGIYPTALLSEFVL